MLELKPGRTDVQIILLAPAWSTVYMITDCNGGSPLIIPAWKDVNHGKQ
ncbi:MAG: hypothetical protein GQ565_01790 [Candidatus Aegiribacteria sp.]|nr:hypothetical protein [Candidatus Aegiribacteria sp.]